MASRTGSGPGREDGNQGAGARPGNPRPTVPGGSGSPNGGNGRTDEGGNR
jgi:hypothetical protein